MFVPVPPRRLCVGAGALSPEKGGALRKQSIRERRLGVAVVLCGGVFAAPLLLLQQGSARASRVATASEVGVTQDALHAQHAPSLYSAVQHSQLVRYDSAPVPAVPTTPTTAAPTTTTTTAPPVLEHASVPVTTTTTTSPVVAHTVAVSAPPAAADTEHGQATWYAAAPPGRCASPTLPFGTVVTVTNSATGASTTCVVDDREEAGYPRVVDMSPSGFAQLADPDKGVVDVTISW